MCQMDTVPQANVFFVFSTVNNFTLILPLMNLFKLFKRKRISIGFISYPFNKVKLELEGWIRPSLTEKWKVKQFSLKGIHKLSSIYSISDDDAVKVIIWQPASINFDMVAFITNMGDGWLTLLTSYSYRYNRKTIQIDLSDPKKEYPIYKFDVRQGKSDSRIVQAMKDSDKWVFYEKGNTLPFEQRTNYTKRKISDRLNNLIIEDYLKKNGIDINKEDFWRSKGNAVEFFTKLGKA